MVSCYSFLLVEENRPEWLTVLASSMLTLNCASYSWEGAMLGETGEEKLAVGMIIVYVYEIPGNKRKNLNPSQIFKAPKYCRYIKR